MEVNQNYREEVMEDIKSKLLALPANDQVVIIYNSSDEELCRFIYDNITESIDGGKACLTFQNSSSTLGMYGIVTKSGKPSYFKIPANNYSDYIIKGSVSKTSYSGDLQFSDVDWATGKLNVINDMRVCL